MSASTSSDLGSSKSSSQSYDPCPGQCGYVWVVNDEPPNYGFWAIDEVLGHCGPIELCDCPPPPGRLGLYEGEIVLFQCRLIPT
jgi:hypothetical protein